MALGPLVTANVVLNNFAEHRARSDLQATTQQYISRAETVLNDAVALLRHLANRGISSCAMDSRRQFGKMLVANGKYVQIGVADAQGFPMCLVPERPLIGVPILPKLETVSPRIAISLAPQIDQGVRSALVSWRLSDDRRLFVQLSPAVMELGAGAHYLAKDSRIELALSGQELWVEKGRLQISKGASVPLPSQSTRNMSDTLIEQLDSGFYPLSVTVTTSRNAVNALVAELKVVAAIACAIGAIVMVGIGIWFAWRPASEAEDEFVKAIKNDEFIPYYQPVIDIFSGELKGCEVLMRWRQADGSMVPPGQFMTYAEASGHIFEMTRRMMRLVASEVADLYSSNPDLKLSINLFAGHFKDDKILKDVLEVFEPSKIELSQVVLEVTERQPLEDIDLARKLIASFQARNIRVALDDVGTGHGGLAYLQKLGMDILKIDKMFIDPMGSDDNTAGIVDIIVELGDNLGMGIIAEGVENYNQILYLRNLGVTSAQGYVFSRPIPASEFIQYARDIETGIMNPIKHLDEKYAPESAGNKDAEQGAA